MRIGIFSQPATVDKGVEHARLFADMGFGSFWMPQIFGIDALTTLAVVAHEVPGIEFGTAVVPTYPRHPSMLAAQAEGHAVATIEALGEHPDQGWRKTDGLHPLQKAFDVESSDVVREAVAQAALSAESRKITVEIGEIEDATVIGDRDQLIMAVHNLVENAINYSPENTKVSVTTTSDSGIIDISVTDQGIGISELEQDRIFERFYRVDPARSRQTGGTGLGLSIVKHVAAKHGGEVKVWSVENVGSTFSIRLPIYESPMESVE
jgi:anti-sigma regulatory factor (Ser/Thr protein kinase)